MGNPLLLVLAVLCGAAAAVVLVTRHERSRADSLVAGLEARLAAQRDDAVRAAVEQAVTMAGQQLGAHQALGRAGLEQQGEVLSARLGSMQANLDRVSGLVRELEGNRATSYGRLEDHLRSATDTTRDLAETTQALRAALASPSTRGAWGERMAQDVLRAAGMVEGINYRLHQTLEGGSRPDVTFPLPRDRSLHMDVKFPLDNYVRALEADDEQSQVHFRRAFLKDVRNRITEITTRDYIDPAAGTLDYVLLFLPNEHLYGWVHEHDAGLLDEAMAHRVILCSPFTLLAVLAVVRETVDNFALERASQEILGLLGGFRAEWDKFTQAMDQVDRRLSSTRKAFDDLGGVRSRGVERQLRRIDEARAAHGLGDDAVAGDHGHDDGDGVNAPQRPELRAVAGE